MRRKAALVRKSELRTRTALKPWRRAESDKVTPDLANYIAARDSLVGGCVIAHLDSTHVCRNKWGDQIPPSGEYEIDHVDVTGYGKRGPSVKTNLVRACPWGHREKTDNARLWRPLLRSYLRKIEGACWSDAA